MKLTEARQMIVDSAIENNIAAPEMNADFCMMVADTKGSEYIQDLKKTLEATKRHASLANVAEYLAFTIMVLEEYFG